MARGFLREFTLAGRSLTVVADGEVSIKPQEVVNEVLKNVGGADISSKLTPSHMNGIQLRPNLAGGDLDFIAGVIKAAEFVPCLAVLNDGTVYSQNGIPVEEPEYNTMTGVWEMNVNFEKPLDRK